MTALSNSGQFLLDIPVGYLAVAAVLWPLSRLVQYLWEHW